MDIITGNRLYRGAVQFVNAILNAGCVGNIHVAAGAKISAAKLEHEPRLTYGQLDGSATVAETKVVHVVSGTAGTLKAIRAGVATACIGDSTITVDVHKNGVTVLNAAITIDSGDAAYALVDGVIDTATLAADDVLEVVVTVNAGTGTLGQGLFVNLDLYEDAL